MATAAARPAGGGAAVWRHAFPRPWFRQCLPVSVLVRGGSFSIPGQPGGLRVGRDRPCAGGRSPAALGTLRRERRVIDHAGGADLGAKRHVQRRLYAVRDDPRAESRLLDGAQ